jgi:hypothetical protein
MRIYENGELAGENTQTTGPLAAGGPLKIGCDGSYGNNFDGRIDEVRLYDRALGEGEVGADMEAPIQTPKQGPVAAYSFDEGEGITAEDASGNGHEGTIEGAGWTRGRYGDALRFVQNEGRQCVTVADSPDLRLEEEFTLEAWVRPEEWLGGSSIVSKELEPGSGQSYSLGIGFTEYGRVEGWSEDEVVYSPEPIEEDVWTHVAYTYDGRRARIYLDGELVSDKAVGPRELASTGPLEIGCDSPELGAQFSGRIDEVRLYDRALDGGEVDTDMEAPIQTPKQGPVAAYSFDEGEGTTVEDLTGDGHTATIHGAGWTTHGRYGGAMEFDAAGESYLSIPDSPELDLTEEFTLEAWVRPGSELNEWAPIIAKETGGGEASHELAYWLYEGDRESNQPYGGTEPAPGEKDEAHAEDPLPVDVWSHLALTYDGAKVRLYVDGELVDCSPVVPAGAPPVTEGELDIGGASEQEDFFTGRIDEVRVYDRGLSQAEIQQTMNASLPDLATNPAEGVESNSAVMTGTVRVIGGGTEYFFEYGPTTEYGSVATGEELQGSGKLVEVEETAVNLLPETTYHYRLVSEGPAGLVYGKDRTFTSGTRTMSVEEEEVERSEEEAPLEEEDSSPSLNALAKSDPGEFFGIMWSGDIKRMVEKGSYNKIEESGAKTVRFAVAENDEAGIAEAFEAAYNHHLTPLPYLGEGGFPRGTARTNFFTFAKRMVETYGPGTKYNTLTWEIWNEPNMRHPLNPNARPLVYKTPEYEGNVNAPEFATFYKELVQQIRSVKPGIEILAPGLFGYKHSEKEVLETPRAFLKQFNAALGTPAEGEPPFYEGLSLHPYVFKTRHPKKKEAAHAPTNEGDAKQVGREIKGEISGVQSLEKEMLGARQPVWVTELGFPVKSEIEGHVSKPIPPVEPGEQKLLLLATFPMLHRTKALEVERAIYYNIEDLAGESWEHHCGLFDGNHEPRPAWTAFTKLAGGK